LVRFLRHEISYEYTVDAGSLSFVSEFLNSKLQQRIEIAEENDRNISFLARVRNNFQYVTDAKVVTQRAFRCPLNDWSISHRIRERNSELDYRRAYARQLED
jgi:hypothetical protein